MKIRLGYACISETVNTTSSTPYPYTTYKEEQDDEKLHRIIESNLKSLEEIIDYNIKNNIHFYRMSSNIIPLATKKEVEFDYIKNYSQWYKKIARKIEDSNMRVDFHPSEYCVINSSNPSVVKNSVDILEYQYKLLEILNVKNKVLVLHVGSSSFGKKNSFTRFINSYNRLPSEVRECLVIENDDKIFNINDCLYLNSKINTPIVLDYHHYICNNNGDNIYNYINKIFDTWKTTNPKLHFSSPKNKTKKEFRSHNDYIDVDSFIRFIENIKKFNYDIDVMLEAKKKDEALFRLVRQLKYKTNYKFIDDTTFVV